MDFRDALNIAIGDITPQPWEYTDLLGTTLTVIPAGLPAGPGDAEVTIRITAGKTQAVTLGITTEDMPGLIAALTDRQEWRHETALDDVMSLTPTPRGVHATVTEVNRTSGRPILSSSAYVPEAQRLPLASALRRALDVARAWED